MKYAMHARGMCFNRATPYCETTTMLDHTIACHLFSWRDENKKSGSPTHERLRACEDSFHRHNPTLYRMSASHLLLFPRSPPPFAALFIQLRYVQVQSMHIHVHSRSRFHSWSGVTA